MAHMTKAELSEPERLQSSDGSSDSQSSMESYEAESLGQYHEGGFHPVELGDLLNNGIYRIERKLGSGSYSTVWLATHTTLMCLRAIKIIRADASLDRWESRVLRHIKASYPGHPGHLNILEPEATFELDGPNGRHECIVFPVTHGSLGGYSPRNTPGSLQSVITQVLRGLTLIHKAGFVHCDFRFSNIQVDTRNKEQYLAADALEQLFPKGKRLKLDVGTGDRMSIGVPNYLYQNPNRNFANVTAEEAIFKVADLGAAIEIGTNPGLHVTPVGLHAPEQIFHLPLDGKLDIWTFGCSEWRRFVFLVKKHLHLADYVMQTKLYETVTRGPFIHTELCPDTYGDKSIGRRIEQLIRYLGPVPADLCQQWERADEFLDSEGRLLIPGKCWLLPLPDCIFNVRVAHGENGVKDWSEIVFEKIKREEKDLFVDFLCSMLRWRPADRPSAEELLRHPWLGSAGG